MSVRLDDLRTRGLMIYQDSELFCFGTDAILLARTCAISAAMLQKRSQKCLQNIPRQKRLPQNTPAT